MSKARETAQQQLGPIDFSHYDKEKEVAQQSYNTSKGSLENNFNNLLTQIGMNKDTTKKSFNMGRSTVAENAFNQNRLNQLDVGSRVTGKSGLQELGEVGNRIETGRQYSGLANTYYDDMNKLKTTEDQSKTAYEFDQQNLMNELNRMLTGVDSRKGEANNNYNMTIGQLAESIQGRWDANANAEKALAQARSAQAQNAKIAQQQLSAQKKSALVDILNSGKSTASKQADIQRLFGVDAATARSMINDSTAIGNPGAVSATSRLNQAYNNIGLPSSMLGTKPNSGSLDAFLRSIGG